jgi:hypothetical protein
LQSKFFSRQNQEDFPYTKYRKNLAEKKLTLQMKEVFAKQSPVIFSKTPNQLFIKDSSVT